VDVVASILLTLLAVVGVLLALLLLAPLSASAAADVDSDAFHGHLGLRFRWAFGLLGLDFELGRGGTLRVLGFPVKRLRRDTPSPDTRPPKKPRKHRTRKPRKRGPRWAWRHRHVLWQAALRILATLHVRGHVRGVIGLAEPDETVWLGLALIQLEARLPVDTIDLDLDYTDAIVDVEGRLTSWIVPAHALLVALSVYFSPDLRRALRTA